MADPLTQAVGTKVAANIAVRAGQWVFARIRPYLPHFDPQHFPGNFFWFLVLFGVGLWVLHYEIRPLTTPRLKGEILSVDVGDMADAKQSGVSITVRLDIYNAGTPTVIREPRLRVRLSEALIPPVEPYYLITDNLDQGKFWGHSYRNKDGGTNYLAPNRDVLLRTLENPIAAGAGVTGYMPFFFRDQQRNAFEIAGAHYTLSFRDVTGRKYEFNYIWSGKARRL